MSLLERSSCGLFLDYQKRISGMVAHSNCWLKALNWILQKGNPATGSFFFLNSCIKKHTTNEDIRFEFSSFELIRGLLLKNEWKQQLCNPRQLFWQSHQFINLLYEQIVSFILIVFPNTQDGRRWWPSDGNYTTPLAFVLLGIYYSRHHPSTGLHLAFGVQRVGNFGSSWNSVNSLSGRVWN